MDLVCVGDVMLDIRVDAAALRRGGDVHGRVLLQPGGGVGIAGWLAVYPEQRVVVAILSNLTGSSLGGGPRRAVAESFLR